MQPDTLIGWIPCVRIAMRLSWSDMSWSPSVLWPSRGCSNLRIFCSKRSMNARVGGRKRSNSMPGRWKRRSRSTKQGGCRKIPTLPNVCSVPSVCVCVRVCV